MSLVITAVAGDPNPIGVLTTNNGAAILQGADFRYIRDRFTETYRYNAAHKMLLTTFDEVAVCEVERIGKRGLHLKKHFFGKVIRQYIPFSKCKLM